MGLRGVLLSSVAAPRPNKRFANEAKFFELWGSGMSRLILHLCFLLAIVAPVAAEDLEVGEAAEPIAGTLDVEQVQSDVRDLLDASYGGDVEVALRLTHPVLIKALGGRGDARKSFTTAIERVKSLGLKVQSFEFSGATSFVAGNDERLYAIVPTRVIVSAGAKKLVSRNFQIGVREEEGGAWTYIEGSKFDAAIRAEHFDDFPEEYKFPKTSRVLQ